MNTKVNDAINAQVNREFYSAYLYLSMSAWAESKDYPGFANWFRVQWNEELDHAQKFMNFVYRRGGTVELEKIDKPDIEWKSLLDAFEATLAHEKKVTGHINDLVTLAREEQDYAFESELKWFVDEQVEEEENDMQIIAKLKMIGACSGEHFYMLDKEMGARVYRPIPLGPGASSAAA